MAQTQFVVINQDYSSAFVMGNNITEVAEKFPQANVFNPKCFNDEDRVMRFEMNRKCLPAFPGGHSMCNFLEPSFDDVYRMAQSEQIRRAQERARKEQEEKEQTIETITPVKQPEVEAKEQVLEPKE